MNLAILGRIINASLKTHDMTTPKDVEVTNIFGNENIISLTTEAKDETLTISIKKMEEKNNDITI